MKINEILDELKYNNGIFPRKALTEAVRNQELIIPELLKTIEYSGNNIELLLDEKEVYFGHIFAMYLLAQFREKRAYKLLIKFFSFPEEELFDFTGDVVTEALGRIFASVYDGDINPLKSLIENEDADEFVRSAAMQALVVLVAKGKQSRQEIVSYFKELFNGKLERRFSHTWSALVGLSTDLYPEEVYEEIKKAFNDKLTDPFHIHFEEVEDTLNRGKEKTINELHNDMSCNLIEDTIKELEHWACFYKPEQNECKVSSNKNIGRNKPCPCGSGKKYKKCCINKT